MKYLPVHPAMDESLTVGMQIVHNGDGLRQGWKGTITSISKVDSKVFTVCYSNGTIAVYTRAWFLCYMAVDCGSIVNMHPFNGQAYINKYTAWVQKADYFNVIRSTHSQMKQIEDHAISCPVKPTKVEHKFTIPAVPTKWVAISSEGLYKECSTEYGLKAEIALAFAENPDLTFDVYVQVGKASAEITTTKTLKFTNA